MKSALRLSPDLIHQAELEARLHKRTVPKQIEYWAEIGKQVANLINPGDLIAVSQGIARLSLETTASYPIDPAAVFNTVNEQRASEYLATTVTKAPVFYEASQIQPGLLDRVQADGSRETGHFNNGEFILATDSLKNQTR